MANIPNCLLYWGYMISGLGRAYIYTPPVGGFINHDATEYAAITGPDAGILPPFALTAGDPVFAVMADIWVAQKYAGDNFPAAESKLAGIASGATANDTDANLRARANHTGTQTASTISDFTTAERAAFSAGSGINIASGVISASGSSLSFANPTRSLNSAFQVDTGRNAIVSYSVDIACSLSLTGGQAGTVYLRYADDSAHTTNVKEVCRFAASNTGTLTIGLALNQIATGTLSGVIPAGKYVKLVSANDTGTPTFTYRNAQEVLI